LWQVGEDKKDVDEGGERDDGDRTRAEERPEEAMEEEVDDALECVQYPLLVAGLSLYSE
jgi:hypothetical protein